MTAHRATWCATSGFRSRPDLVVIALLLAGSVAVRLRWLDRPLLGDELISFSNMVLGRSFHDIVFGPFDSNNHVLNSIVMKAVYLGFGEAPVLMRLPNLLMVLTAVVLLYISGSRILGRAGGLAAALLLAFHPAMVLYSVSCRGYAGMVLFTLVSSVLMLELLRAWSRPRWIACALSGVVACGFHLFSINVLIAQILLVTFAVVRPAGDKPSRPGRVALAPIAALTSVVALSAPAFVHAGSGERFPFQAAFPAALVNFLGGHAYRTALDVPSVLLAIAAVAGCLGLARHLHLRRYAVLLFVSPAALYALSFLAPVFTLHPRFFCFLLPLFCLLLAAAARLAISWADAATPAGSSARPLIRIVAASFVVLTVLTFADRIRIPRSDWLVRAQTEVREFIAAHPGAVILTNDPGFVRVRLRQERNMDRIRPALGVKAIRAVLADQPDAKVYVIYVPRKRLTESDLIHHKGTVAPEVLYRRDDWLRGYLERNGTVVVALEPRMFIYALASERPQQ